MPDNNTVYANGLFLKNQTINGRNGDFDILKMRVNVEKFTKFLNENKNENGSVNIDIRARREVGQFGDTHMATLNSFVPKDTGDNADAPKQAPKPAGKSAPKPRPAPVAAEGEDDIPF